jgi:multiple sugar transport system permease protein
MSLFQTMAGATKRRRRLTDGARHLVLICISVIVIIPLVWMVASSLKSNSAIFVYPPQLVPTHPLFSNYQKAFDYIPFWLYFRNSVIVSAATICGILFSCVPAAYAFSILRWRGRDLVFFVVLASIMLPFQVLMVPLYVIYRDLHFLGTLLPLIVPPFLGQYIASAFSASLAIFLLRQFFRSLPGELIDAARIDGAGDWAILFRIVLPIARGGLITVTLFSFLSSWTDFLAPLIFLNKASLFTLSLGLQQYQSLHFTAFNYLMAAAFVFALPVLLAFIFAQRFFVEGIALTGLRG